MPPSSTCGQHVELASTNAVRITRCTCGTVHLTMVASGVTIRLSSDALRGLASGLKIAVDRLDEAPQLGSTTIN